MKQLILLLMMTLTFSVNAQQDYYEGIARVDYQDGNYATILFKKSQSSFIVKDPSLVQGKEYNILMQKVKYNGTKESAKIIYKHLDDAQNVRDMRKVKDSISMVLKTKWI